MPFKKTVCVIVDAYSTGKYFAPAFRGRGYECIHIKSSASLPANFRHIESDFLESWEMNDGGVDEILAKLQRFHIKLVLTGSESGIELADELSHRLNLPGNNNALSQARRDKYKMTELVAQRGLKTVKQYESHQVEDVLAWTEELNEEDWPVVLKPLSSQSGDHVFFCKTREDITEAFEEIVSSKNLFGQENLQVLAQSFNGGEEYIVNTISWNGQHFPVEIWYVKKLPNTIVYDIAEILHPESQEFESLVSYTKQVLDTLGITYGPGTTELKYTADKGPILLETTSRPMAGMPLSFCQEVSGFTQISLTVEAYLNPSEFLSRFEHVRPIKKLYGLAVILISDAEGELNREIDIEAFGEIHTLFSYMLNSKVGFLLKKTVDSLTAPGELYLISDDQALVYEDYHRIRKQEVQGMYRQAIQPILAEAVTDKELSLSYLGLWKERLPLCALIPIAQ